MTQTVNDAVRFNLRKVLPSEKRIDSFPLAYNQDATPITQTSFSPTTLKTAPGSRSLLAMKTAKMVVIGDCGVGKTCLVNRFCHNVFDSNYKATIGVDFEVERFDVLDVPFSMQIWDTAGQERFRCIAKSYYRQATVICLAFDLSDLQSLHTVETWLRDALEVNDKNPLLFLVGTKRDLVSDKEYYASIEGQAMKMARKIKAEFWAVSSKRNVEMVHDLFCRIAALAFDRVVCDQSDAKTKQIGTDLIRMSDKTPEKQFCFGNTCKF